MSYPPNVAAAQVLAREILPRVRERAPGARVSLVGRNPRAAVQALAESPGVTVTGEVADVGDWLRRAEAFACPMVSGTGIKNKLLESLACATPSVATPLACQGMAVTHGRELLMAEGVPAFADELVRLLQTPDLGRRLGAAGRSYAESRHSWPAVAESYERLYRELAREPAAVAD